MDNYVSITPEATAYIGYEAVDLFRSRVLASSLRLYSETGMIPTRGVTITRMLALATHYTGKRYGRGKPQAAIAADDVTLWANAFALSLPHVSS